MKEGTVVVIAGKFDERVRKNEESNITGTVVHIVKGDVWVLLPDGNIWVGKEYSVYPKEQYKEGRLKFLESLLDKYTHNTENLLKLIDYVKSN